MNKIIIVGHPQSGIESVEQLLVASGMSLAQPSRRDGLHAREIDAILIKAHDAIPVELIQDATQLQQIQVAPIWQGMVLDLMLSNLDQSLWGWADTQAVYLLDYWKKQDPKAVFVLVYDEPHTALTRLSLEDAAAPQDELQRRLDTWVAYNSALLHFHLRNPQRSVLVHSQQVKPSADRYLQYMSERVTAPLDLSGHELINNLAAPSEDTVASLLSDAQMKVLINLLMQANPQAQALYAELQASSALPANLKPQDALISVGLQNEYYLAWQACIAQQQYIQELNQRFQKKSVESTQLQERIEYVESELDLAYQEIQEQQEQHARALLLAEHAAQEKLKEKSQQLALIESQKEESKQEKNLLLLQLQQVEADLQNTYRVNKEQASTLETIRAELQDKSKQLTDLQVELQKSKYAEQLIKEQLQEKTQKLIADQKQKHEIVQEKDLLFTQLRQVQAEFETVYLKSKEQSSAIEILQAELQSKIKQLAGVKAELETIKKAEQVSQEKLRAQTQKLIVEQKQKHEIIQEKDLLFSQLQHVQTELGVYYSKNKEQTESMRLAADELQTKTKQLEKTQAELKTVKEIGQAVQRKWEEQSKELEEARSESQTQVKQLTGAQAQLKQQVEINLKQEKLKNAEIQQEKLKAIELKKENDLLLTHLQHVQIELQSLHEENKKLKANQKPKPEVHYGAADRVKRQLSYRLGARMIEQSRSLGGWISMPFALRSEVKLFRQDQAARKEQKLPPIHQYGDAHEAELVKRHLSYRLGARMIANSKSLGGWLTMPWALRAEIKDFQKTRR